MRKNKILITGVCGFIGFHLANLFFDNGDHVTGIDNLRKTYNPIFKKKRLSLLSKKKNFKFVKADLTKKLKDSLATLKITLSSDNKPNLLL